MRISRTSAGAALITGVLLLALAGCEKGPAEKAGERVDDAIDKAGESIEKAGESIQDAAEGSTN